MFSSRKGQMSLYGESSFDVQLCNWSMLGQCLPGKVGEITESTFS
jgi:hypothetical protein